MTTATKPPAKGAEKNTETAVEVWTPAAVDQAMSEYEPEKFNRLFVRNAVSQVNPFLAPRFEVVQLNPDVNGPDVYRSDDIKQGHVALTKVALRKIADLAGLTTLWSRRDDDGKDPAYVLWQVALLLRVPGRPDRQAIGSHEIRLAGDAVKGWSPARLAKARQHMVRMAESKATNAAIRDLLTLGSSYPQAVVQRPWVVMRWEANMANPQVAERFLDNLLPATTAAYGPDQPQLAAGPVEIAPHQPDDDEPTDAQYVEVETNGHATVDKDTGEIVSERPAADEPDWFGAADEETAGPSLVDRLKAAGKANKGSGPSTPEQRAALRELTRGLTLEQVLAVLRLGLGFKGDQLKTITTGQAAAIIAVGEDLGGEELRRQWIEAAG